MEEIDVAIIGAGVVGLAIASEVSENHKEVYVFEKNKHFGEETSSRNSEVIHSAIHYPTTSLKNRLCIRGGELIYSMDEELVPRKRIEKIVIATDESEIPELEKMRKRGQDNGIVLRILDSREIRRLEPNVQAILGLHIPSTGIINSHKLMEYFLNKARDNCGINPVVYQSEITEIEKVKEGYKLKTKSGDEFLSRIIINSAGLNSDKIAGIVGIDINSARYRLNPCKGEYFSVSSKHAGKIRRLIYPVQTKISLGIHVVLDLVGKIKLGPNAFYVEDLDYSVDASHQREFFRDAKKFLPFLEYNDLSPDMSGIRPKIQSPKDEFGDFVIKEESERGFPGFINLIGIESPGLTASPAIAEYVQEIVKQIS